MAKKETKKKDQSAEVAAAEDSAADKGATTKAAKRGSKQTKAGAGAKKTGAKAGKKPTEKAEKKSAPEKAPETTMPRLLQYYRDTVAPQLMVRFAYKNPMQVPRLQKIVVNMGVGEAIQNPKAIDGAVADLTVISGQKPNIRRARKSVSNFKLRAGMPIGCAVTLRHRRMWEFLDRLVTFSIPRIRDFRGVPRKGFDGRGNYTLGLKEQLIFPEVDYDSVDAIRGMNVSFVTTARTDEEGLELLGGLGMPFVRQS